MRTGGKVPRNSAVCIAVKHRAVVMVSDPIAPLVKHLDYEVRVSPYNEAGVAHS